MKKNITLFFRIPGTQGFIQDPHTRHEHDDEIIAIYRRRKDAKKSRIHCAGTMIEATHKDFDQLQFILSFYAIKSLELEQDLYLDMHPKHYTTIYNIIAELKP